MIQELTVNRVLDAALGTGADFAELFVDDCERNSLLMADGHVEQSVSSHRHGAGVRVMRGEQQAYAYSADTGEEALLETAKAAAAALKGQRERTALPTEKRTYRTPQEIAYRSVTNDRRVALMHRGYAAGKAVSDKIRQMSVNYFDEVQRVQIVNTEGVWAEDERPRTRIMLNAVAAEGAKAERGGESPGCCRGFEAYSTVIDVEAAAKKAAERAVLLLSAEDCPGGNMPVVISGGFGGVIFHEACGHSLEATSVGPGDSEFCGKLNTQIAAPCVSAMDDGTMPFEWGTINIDDEGTPGQQNLLIENGILKSYLIDRLGSRRLHLPMTGSSRRQDYTYAPTSRMTNTFICAGHDDPDEMIRTMGTGLYAASLGGGSVNPLTGEFNFAVAEGYWVRDGKILHPVRGAMLIGRGAEILQRIDRVGPVMWMAQGMCGSLSGSVPTNVGQPVIRVTSITVGGKGGAK